MNFGIPQIIYLFLSIFGLGVVLERHGQPKDTNYNFWWSLVQECLLIYLLNLGGFF